ncbi:Spherulation-specific family 4-domain-containing protein [Xylariales sp. PMI_506]|nr:Spherulation-specific family 4-domain-containing protein [Xylariales sp. PMI_506]
MQLLSFSLLAATTAATEILLPLYNAPGTSGSAWAPVQSAFAANPNVNAKVVINYNSGPGSLSGSDGPDWIAGADSLTSLSNVAVLGYVHCSYGERDINDVEADVATWASWVDQGVEISGIFLDESPSTVNTTIEAYMKAVTAYIRDTEGFDFVVYNSGFPSTVGALDPYFALGPDLIVGLETCFTETTDGVDLCTPAGYTIYDQGGYGTTIDGTLDAWIGSEYYSQTAILIHGFHGSNGLYTASESVLSSELQAIVNRGIGAAVFVSEQWTTPATGPADIGTVATLLGEILSA